MWFAYPGWRSQGVCRYACVRVPIVRIAQTPQIVSVEASSSAEAAQILINENGLQDRIEIVRGRVEDVHIPETVDIIISEPIGFLLVHERMLESYIVARNRFLRPSGGLMFPTNGTIFLSPCTDEVVFNEQLSKITFWQVNSHTYIYLDILLDK